MMDNDGFWWGLSDSEEMIGGLLTMNGLKMGDTVYLFKWRFKMFLLEKMRMIHWLLGDLLFLRENQRCSES